MDCPLLHILELNGKPKRFCRHELNRSPLHPIPEAVCKNCRIVATPSVDPHPKPTAELLRTAFQSRPASPLDRDASHPEARASRKRETCIHLGNQLRIVNNTICGCGGEGKMPVFSCAIHGECTPHQCRERGKGKYHACSTCEQFETASWKPVASPDDLARTLAIIPVYGQHELLRDLFKDIGREPVDSLVVDNGCDFPSDGLPPRTTIHYRPQNVGWLGGCNDGVKHIVAGELCSRQREYDRFVLLNSDLRLSAGFFAGLIHTERRTGASIIAASYDGQWPQQRAPGLAAGRTLEADKFTPRDEYVATGGCDGTAVSIRREVFDRVGLFDAGHFGKFGHRAMADLCYRARAVGMTTAVSRAAYAHHVGGGKQTALEVHGQAYDSLAGQEGEAGMRSKWGDGWQDLRNVPTTEPCVVYTCITAGRDTLKPPAFVPPGWRFVCFTDDWTLAAPGWEVLPLAWQHPTDPRRTARWHKTHPEQLFPKATVSIWADASIRASADWRPLLWQLGSADVATYKHSERDCIYQEAEECKRLGLDDPAVIDAQVEGYREIGYAEHAGLAETSVVIRRHSPDVAGFDEYWWTAIGQMSRRDQISFNVGTHLWGLRLQYIDDILRRSKWLKRDTQDKRRRVP